MSALAYVMKNLGSWNPIEMPAGLLQALEEIYLQNIIIHERH
jgi:hypothetical protein